MASELDITPGHLLGLLLERMQHVHRIGERSDVNDAKLPTDLNANLADAGPDGWQGLPVVWLTPQLHLVQFVPRPCARLVGKCAKIIARGAETHQRLGHDRIYTWMYIVASRLTTDYAAILCCADARITAASRRISCTGTSLQTSQLPPCQQFGNS